MTATWDPAEAARLVDDLRRTHVAIRDAMSIPSGEFQAGDVLDREDVELLEQKFRALCAVSGAIKPPGKFYTTSSLMEAAKQLEAAAKEVANKQRGYNDLHAMLPGPGDIWSKVSAVVSERDRLRGEMARLQMDVMRGKP